MINRILILFLGGGIALGVTRYVVQFFIQGTTFSANVTSGNITDITGNVTAFTGSLAGNNTIQYIVPFAIFMAILIGIFMVVKRNRRKNV